MSHLSARKLMRHLRTLVNSSYPTTITLDRLPVLSLLGILYIAVVTNILFIRRHRSLKPIQLKILNFVKHTEAL